LPAGVGGGMGVWVLPDSKLGARDGGSRKRHPVKLRRMRQLCNAPKPLSSATRLSSAARHERSRANFQSESPVPIGFAFAKGLPAADAIAVAC